ncbi:MAG TPA: DUF192 domain-containing protein [Acidisarcina sp.]
MRRIAITNLTRSVPVGSGIGVAETSWSRVIGLLGRPALACGDGILIRPSSGVHTFGMRFAIDVVGLDGDLRVVKLWPGLVPWRVTAISFRVRSVLELALGEIAARDLHLGDRLAVSAVD